MTRTADREAEASKKRVKKTNAYLELEVDDSNPQWRALLDPIVLRRTVMNSATRDVYDLIQRNPDLSAAVSGAYFEGADGLRSTVIQWAQRTGTWVNSNGVDWYDLEAHFSTPSTWAVPGGAEERPYSSSGRLIDPGDSLGIGCLAVLLYLALFPIVIPIALVICWKTPIARYVGLAATACLIVGVAIWVYAGFDAIPTALPTVVMFLGVVMFLAYRFTGKNAAGTY